MVGSSVAVFRVESEALREEEIQAHEEKTAYGGRSVLRGNAGLDGGGGGGGGISTSVVSTSLQQEYFIYLANSQFSSHCHYSVLRR